jgi:hypothetical protein
MEFEAAKKFKPMARFSKRKRQLIELSLKPKISKSLSKSYILPLLIGIVIIYYQFTTLNPSQLEQIKD